MCLGIPGRISEIYTAEKSGLLMARVDFGGVGKEVCLSFTPDAAVGQFVMVHVGFAIGRIDEEEAERTMEVLREMGEGEGVIG